MTTNLPSSRRDIIAGRLDTGHAVTANALAAEFDVSEDAIRRDLRALAAEGRCRRVYGGALPIVRGVKPVAARRGEGSEQKRTLALAAASLVTAGDFLFLDSGSTNFELADCLPDDADLTVATNSVDIAGRLLQRHDVRVLVVGGLADTLVGGCVDAVAVQAVVQMRFDVAFIGACAVSVDGLAADHFEDATFKRAVVSSAGRTIALATADKIDRRALHQIVPLQRVDTLIVGPEASGDQRQALDAAGARILVAGQD